MSEVTDATVRPYRPADHGAGRRLWEELTQRHRDLYHDPQFGGGDPGAAFEDYLTRLELSGVWVAEHPQDGVVGLVGLILRGRAGTVEPVVVAASHRGRGIGRALLRHVAGEARRRSLKHLTVSPASRDVAALRCLNGAGYDVLSRVELTLDLNRSGRTWQEGLDVHGLHFQY